MIKYYMGALAGAASILASGAAYAQLGNGGATFSDVEHLSGNGADVVARYVGLAQGVMNAESTLLAAVNLKAAADKAANQGKGLTPDATRGTLESAIKVQVESGQILEQQLGGKAAELNEANKKQFGDGVRELARGVTEYAGMSKDLTGLKKTLKPTGGTATSALYLSKTLPETVKELTHTLKSAIDYSKANNIPVPQEALDATATL
ncbi:MAG: hypothetical protein V4724_33585 [Pseudomonadota bacterium]